MDNKLKIKEALKKKLRQEMSMTGTGASVTPGTGEGVATKYAFGKSTGGGIPKDWKAAPSIPNRPSKAMDYKKIFEGELKPGVKYNYKGESGFISTGGSSDPKNWKFLGDKGKYPYLAVKADLVPSERQPGKYDGAFDLGIGKGHYIDETEKTTDKIHIGTNTKTDSDIYFEPSTGTFSINIIDPAGNRTNKLQVNTIDDVLAKFPNWKWTEQGKAEFSDALNEEQLEEATIPDNIKKFAQRKGVTNIVNQVARWAEKVGARIAGGTAVGMNYSTLVLDLDYKQQGEIRINTDNKTIKLYDKPVDNFNAFQRVYVDYKDLDENIERDQKVKIIKGTHTGNIATVHDFDSEKDTASGDDWVDVLIGDKKEKKTVKASELKPLNENYARFRNETKTRTKPEQFHNAVKSVKQKVNEINRLFEYMNRLQSELSESDGGLKHKKYTEKSIQQIKESTKQLFFKSTKLK